MVGQDVQTNLLVDVAIAWAPPVDLVVARRAIDCGLRVDGQEAQLVEGRELRDDGVHLRRGLLVAPWQGCDIAAAEAGKKGPEVCQCGRTSPKLQAFLFLQHSKTINVI